MSTRKSRDEAIASVQTLCRVDEARARHLVQSASGSVERAVALHFQDGGGASLQNNAAQKVKDDDDDNAALEISKIQSICSASEKRAQELWDASNGSLERAIDIHFAKMTGRAKSLAPSNKTPKKSATRTPASITSTSKPKKATPMTAGSKRQSTLHAFLGLPEPHQFSLD